MQSLTILITPTREFVLSDRHIERIARTVPDARLCVKPLRDVTPEDLQGADIVFGYPGKDWVAEAPRLRWVQLASAGADSMVGVRPGVLVTKSSGVFGIPISEWVIGSMLMLTRHLHIYRDQQRAARWEERAGAREVFGSTVGVVGMGDLGREIARRAGALGCRVLGSRRRTAPDALPFFDAVLPLDELIPQVDFLVVALPGTTATRGLVSAERLRRLKPGAYLLNVGRGSTVDEPALIAALQSGHLAGAALDVTAVEPLPADSPLWQMENVIISPHTSGRSPEANADRRTAIFCDNLRRYLAGQPLVNLVDLQAGY